MTPLAQIARVPEESWRSYSGQAPTFQEHPSSAPTPLTALLPPPTSRIPRAIGDRRQPPLVRQRARPDRRSPAPVLLIDRSAHQPRAPRDPGVTCVRDAKPSLVESQSRVFPAGPQDLTRASARYRDTRSFPDRNRAAKL